MLYIFKGNNFAIKGIILLDNNFVTYYLYAQMLLLKKIFFLVLFAKNKFRLQFMIFLDDY